MCQGRLILHRAIPVSSDVGYARKKQSTGYKSLPHRIRRVFERRNAQKPELYGVRRFAKRNWNRPAATLPSHPGQGVTSTGITCARFEERS